MSYRSGRQLPEYRKTVKGVEHFIVLLESSEGGVGEKGGKRKKRAMRATEYSPESSLSSVGESGTVVVQTLCKSCSP